MFNWLLRYVLLRGLAPATVDACIAHPEVRALLKFRFVYLFAFHAPVLLPLLELLAGHRDPALGVLSLGLASLTMVLADVPTGLYADRHGAKAALRLGLQMTCLIMLGFFLLGLWRAAAVARGVAPGSWLPGIVGLLVLEGAIGVSLALLSGADTVLFLAVAQRSGIAGLDRSGFEGVGSAIRYFGTMVAVVMGALLYDGIGVLVRQPALRIGLQNGLFLLTLLSMGQALRTLARLPDARAPAAAGHPLVRPGFAEVFRALFEVMRWPAFFWRMWMLCLTSAAALFAVYVVQSPLSRLAGALTRKTPAWWPLYTVLATLGYWASSRGSRAFRHHHDRTDRPGGQVAVRSTRPLWFAVSSLGLLALYPLLYASRPSPEDGRWPLLLAAALVCLLFNYLRGFVEPYSATALIEFTQAKGLLVPASLVSGFNSLKRGVHFVLSALFFAAQQRAVGLQQEPDAVLSATLSWVCVAFAVLLIPAAWSTTRSKREELASSAREETQS